jgi:hypothetical protein
MRSVGSMGRPFWMIWERLADHIDFSRDAKT